MTRAKRLIEAKKELRKVRKRMKLYIKKYNNPNEYFYSDIEEYCFPKNVWNYDIITKDGTKYILNNCSKSFPNIDFKDIIFVEKNMYTSGWYKRKKDGKIIDITNKYNVYNTLEGFICSNSYSRTSDIEKKYNVTNIIGEYQD